jgi:hypothetical protein
VFERKPEDRKFQHLNQVLDLILEGDRVRIHAGEIEVRAPPAPTVMRGDG